MEGDEWREEDIREDTDHEVRFISGVEVWVGVRNDYLNSIAVQLGTERYKISKSVAVKLPKGWAVFISPDEEGWTTIHAYIPAPISIETVEEIIKILEREAATLPDPENGE